MAQADNLTGKKTEGVPILVRRQSDDFWGPCDDDPFPTEADTGDFKGEFAVVVDDIPMGSSAARCGSKIRLVMTPIFGAIDQRFVKTSQQILQIFMPGPYSPPPPLGELVAMLDRSDEGQRIQAYMNRSCLALVDSMYEHDRAKIHLRRPVSENLHCPDALGTGMGVLLMPGIIHSYGVIQPVGGSGMLTESLVRCIEALGGEVRCHAEAAKAPATGPCPTWGSSPCRAWTGSSWPGPASTRAAACVARPAPP